MHTLAQDNPEVSQGAVSYNMSNLQQLHVFQFGHSTDRPQNKPQQVHVHVFQLTGSMCKNCIAIKLPSPVHPFALLYPPVVC